MYLIRILQTLLYTSITYSFSVDTEPFYCLFVCLPHGVAFVHGTLWKKVKLCFKKWNIFLKTKKIRFISSTKIIKEDYHSHFVLNEYIKCHGWLKTTTTLDTPNTTPWFILVHLIYFHFWQLKIRICGKKLWYFYIFNKNESFFKYFIKWVYVL